MASEKLARPRLLYFADTMCSWCYGFGPQMDAILQALGDRVEVLLFSGGLRPFTTEPVTEKTRNYLAETFQRISDLTGQPFVDGPLQQPGFIYDTEPASRAVVTMRSLAPGLEYPYMLAIQRAFYAGGQDITKPEVLANHAAGFGFDRAAFLDAFESDVMKQATLSDFQVAQRLGIDGFPTLVLHRQKPDGEDELILVGKGYGQAEEIIANLEAVLAQG